MKVTGMITASEAAASARLALQELAAHSINIIVLVIWPSDLVCSLWPP